MASSKSKVTKVALDFAKSHKRLPTLNDLSIQGVTRSMVRESFRTLNELNKYILENSKHVAKAEQPKILLLDIETAPMLGYIWGLFDQNIGLEMVASDWHLLSWSAKWLGTPEDQVMYYDQRDAKNIEDDKAILKIIWNLLDEADIIITQNGKKFDAKKLNARFIFHGFKPPSSYRHIDTYQLAKKHFAFSSNKLAYMTDKLCTKYKKLSHAKFSGFSLWKECLAGNIEAWDEMKKYNMYDVLSLEELYTKLIPWDRGINFSAYSSSEESTCNCGSTNLKKKGYHYTNKGKYQRYICQDCGAELRDSKNLLTKEKRSNLKS